MLFVLNIYPSVSREEFLDNLTHQAFTRPEALQANASKQASSNVTSMETVYFMAYGLIVARFPEAIASQETFREKADLLLTFCNPTKNHPETTLLDECDFDETLEKPADDAGEDAWIDWQTKTGIFDKTISLPVTCQAFVDWEVKMATALSLSKELGPTIDYMPYVGEGFGHLTILLKPVSWYYHPLSKIGPFLLPIFVGLVAYYLLK